MATETTNHSPRQSTTTTNPRTRTTITHTSTKPVTEAVVRIRYKKRARVITTVQTWISTVLVSQRRKITQVGVFMTMFFRDVWGLMTVKKKTEKKIVKLFYVNSYDVAHSSVILFHLFIFTVQTMDHTSPNTMKSTARATTNRRTVQTIRTHQSTTKLPTRR